jgi:hypothetical protein
MGDREPIDCITQRFEAIKLRELRELLLRVFSGQYFLDVKK